MARQLAHTQLYVHGCEKCSNVVLSLFVYFFGQAMTPPFMHEATPIHLHRCFLKSLKFIMSFYTGKRNCKCLSIGKLQTQFRSLYKFMHALAMYFDVGNATPKQDESALAIHALSGPEFIYNHCILVAQSIYIS